MLMYINKAYNNADESLVWSKICLGNKEKESWHDIILLCYTHLRQLFFSLIFFRFSLMSTVYEKNHIFLVVFVWFAWLLSKYKNSFFFVFVTICVANIRLEFRSNHLRCLYKKLFIEILQYSQGKHLCWSARTNLHCFSLLTYSCSQNSWCY